MELSSDNFIETEAKINEQLIIIKIILCLIHKLVLLATFVLMFAYFVTYFDLRTDERIYRISKLWHYLDRINYLVNFLITFIRRNWSIRWQHLANNSRIRDDGTLRRHQTEY